VGTIGKVWRWAKRRPALASMAAALAILIPAALAGMTLLYLNADHQRELAEDREREMLRWRVENAAQMSKHADALKRLPVTEATLEAHRRCVEELERLAALGIDPVANRFQRAHHLDSIVYCCLTLERTAEALEVSLQAVAAFEACLAEQPESEMVQYRRQGTRHNRAASLQQAGQFSEALQALDGLIDEVNHTYGPSSTWNTLTRRRACNLYKDRALCRHELRRYADAISDFDIALQHSEEKNWQKHSIWRAISLAHCGRAAEAIEQCRGPLSNPQLGASRVYDAAKVHAAASVAPELPTPQREAAAREAVELVKRAIAGNADFRASVAKEAELLPLRDRADFKAVVGATPEKPVSPPQ
jgi:tetratricopeptide (TPR) repeat protein